ncbi:uncharacterized protein LOC115670532 [Syzygium oleosum]|uniref:uncharacterized protein LOC115670532 n=1 Tax=Syzygium oleosum TaxID=219896 RepID=UPI0011D2B4E2|nr:uncharacterized protein LOC115670532 [Syzygium oleosum]
MRFFVCKLHCPPFVCFCKPSSHIYAPGPLKLEDAPHVPPPEVSVSDGSDQLCGETAEVGDDAGLDEKNGETDKVIIKSCLKKKKAGLEALCAEKKQVQWVDLLGKELAEVKEFESSEVEEDYGGNGHNLCVIL